MLVVVKNNDVMKAYRKLKKKLHNEDVVKETMKRRHYVKPSDVKRAKKQEAIRRIEKEKRKRIKYL